MLTIWAPLSAAHVQEELTTRLLANNHYRAAFFVQLVCKRPQPDHPRAHPVHMAHMPTFPEHRSAPNAILETITKLPIRAHACRVAAACMHPEREATPARLVPAAPMLLLQARVLRALYVPLEPTAPFQGWRT